MSEIMDEAKEVIRKARSPRSGVRGAGLREGNMMKDVTQLRYFLRIKGFLNGIQRENCLIELGLGPTEMGILPDLRQHQCKKNDQYPLVNIQKLWKITIFNR